MERHRQRRGHARPARGGGLPRRGRGARTQPRGVALPRAPASRPASGWASSASSPPPFSACRHARSRTRGARRARDPGRPSHDAPRLRPAHARDHLPLPARVARAPAGRRVHRRVLLPRRLLPVHVVRRAGRPRRAPVPQQVRRAPARAVRGEPRMVDSGRGRTRAGRPRGRFTTPYASWHCWRWSPASRPSCTAPASPGGAWPGRWPSRSAAAVSAGFGCGRERRDGRCRTSPWASIRSTRP